jgi:hypothetical protein
VCRSTQKKAKKMYPPEKKVKTKSKTFWAPCLDLCWAFATPGHRFPDLGFQRGLRRERCPKDPPDHPPQPPRAVTQGQGREAKFQSGYLSRKVKKKSNIIISLSPWPPCWPSGGPREGPGETSLEDGRPGNSPPHPPGHKKKHKKNICSGGGSLLLQRVTSLPASLWSFAKTFFKTVFSFPATSRAPHKPTPGPSSNWEPASAARSPVLWCRRRIFPSSSAQKAVEKKQRTNNLLQPPPALGAE